MKLAYLILNMAIWTSMGAALSLVYAEHQTRQLAIENGCGGYQHDTGDFRWEKSSVPPVPSSALNDMGKSHAPTKAEADQIKNLYKQEAAKGGKVK